MLHMGNTIDKLDFSRLRFRRSCLDCMNQGVIRVSKHQHSIVKADEQTEAATQLALAVLLNCLCF